MMCLCTTTTVFIVKYAPIYVKIKIDVLLITWVIYVLYYYL